jgi:hypothetical protein
VSRFSWSRAIAQGFLWMILWLGGMFGFHVVREGTAAEASSKLGLSTWSAPLIYASVAVVTGAGFELIRLWSGRRRRRGHEKASSENAEDE